MQKRIEYLDGLRGVAIILVILFHAYACYINGDVAMPYGDKYSHFPIFKYGFLGVQLFFLISGFVILMTLERSDNFLIFGYKRWIRLFPAMLIASLFIYITSTIFYERPLGEPNFWSVISSITFMGNTIIGQIFNVDSPPLETSFWTLYLEVKFYTIFGALFFLFGRTKAIIIFFLFFLYAQIPDDIHTFISFHISNKLSESVGSYYIKFYGLTKNILSDEYGWFISGCLAYLYYQRKDKKIFLILSIFLSLWCIILKFFEYNTLGVVIMGLVIFAIFLLPLVYDRISSIFTHNFLLFIGFISYPLYLIHENMMISMIIQLHRKFPIIPDFLLPFITLIPIIFLSYTIAKWVEPLLKKSIENLIRKIFFR